VKVFRLDSLQLVATCCVRAVSLVRFSASGALLLAASSSELVALDAASLRPLRSWALPGVRALLPLPAEGEEFLVLAERRVCHLDATNADAPPLNVVPDTDATWMTPLGGGSGFLLACPDTLQIHLDARMVGECSPRALVHLEERASLVAAGEHVVAVVVAGARIDAFEAEGRRRGSLVLPRSVCALQWLAADTFLILDEGGTALLWSASSGVRHRLGLSRRAVCLARDEQRALMGMEDGAIAIIEYAQNRFARSLRDLCLYYVSV
jgi:hypothetical protein